MKVTDNRKKKTRAAHASPRAKTASRAKTMSAPRSTSKKSAPVDIKTDRAKAASATGAAKRVAARATDAMQQAVPSPTLFEDAIRAPAASARTALDAGISTASLVRDTASPVADMVTAGTDQAREAYARAQATGEALTNAVRDSMTASARGAAEVNGKVFELLQAQSQAAFDLWRSVLTAGSMAEAVRLQTSGVRQVYEATTTQWKDLAETTSRAFSEAVKPLQSTWTNTLR